MIGKGSKRKETYDSETLVPVLRVSICTGEQTVGFKEKGSGAFHPVQLIQSEKELKKFMKRYGIDRIDREY
ncbi:MAG: aspartate dehydrogenase [Christensenellaceae bacterium]